MDCATITSVYTQGCLYRLSAIISQCAVLLTIGTLCVSLIQILGIVFSHMLAKSIRKLKTQKLVEEEERRRQFYEQVLSSRVETPKQDIAYTVQESEA
ncbi:hypothetical protein GWI33_012115 [Rhynchophorus ferrugineus]|uniref:Uncharacterized protein n=1 Tax=Rhynchophorus ferrugineus TaxID=354439 RepID=A0A834IJE0_RHYFE|nr:hypothetical protein GWI33_012115 [Rhynchophorus ferrugineus]